uniref:Uncharacterized protein n=1 Tax=Arundo donax TaxID=35708 RepID=A0A0A8Y528_ARUDO
MGSREKITLYVQLKYLVTGLRKQYFRSTKVALPKCMSYILKKMYISYMTLAK